MKRWFIGLLLGSVGLLSAQDIDLSVFENLKPRAIGPAGMSGRVTSIDVVPHQPDIIYVGTASGGLWKSTSGGTHWEPIFDEQAVQSIGAVAIDPSNPSIIWVGTGEGNPRNSHNSGKGIYRSLDGGKHWTFMGLEATRNIHRIIVDPTNSDNVYVAAMGSAWGPNPERGVYKTTDGGQSWAKVLSADDSTGCADLVMDPSNPKKLVAALWTFGRKPWTFNSGGEGSGLFITHDGGQTWEERTHEDGLPKGPLGRIGLAISHNKPNVMYALVEAKKLGLYRSTDGGFTWTLRGSDENAGNRPFYYADIFIDPQNENRLYSLWSLLSRSEDGGKSFDILAGYSKLHPDHQAFWVSPEDPDYLIAGNDGGLGISHDGGANWRFVENLPLGQYYHINYDEEVPYNIYGGMQDNGSWVGPAYVWRRGGIRNSYFQELYFGDGFDVVPVPGDSRYGYAMSQGGNVARYDKETGDNVFVKPVHPEGKPLRFNWNAAIAADPFAADALYFGSQYLHHSTDRGQSWSILSPDLTTNDPSKQKQAESGGLTIDATQAENFTTITAIGPSPLDEKVIWVGSDDGNVQLTRDGGDTWANLASKLKGLPAGSWIQQVNPSTYTAGEAWVVANNYRRNDWAPYVYHTDDFGKSWTRVATPNQVEGHTWSLVQDLEEPNLVFLGTEYGLYISFDMAETWHKWTHGYPSVPTRDLKIHPREHDLIIGTFGRAAYIMDDIRPLRAFAADAKVLDQPFVQFPIPDAYLAAIQQPSGARFNAQADWEGENRTSRARLTYYLAEKGQPEEQKGDTTLPKYNWEKLAVTVYNSNGDTIRHYHTDADTGLHRITWNLSTDGTPFPTYRERKEDDNRPSGMAVLPGTYTVALRYGTYADSAEVEVLADPRMPYDLEGEQAKRNYMKEMAAVLSATDQAFEQLKAAKKSLDVVKASMEHVTAKDKDTVMQHSKMMADSLNALMAIYFTPIDFVGYDHVTVRLSDHLQMAQALLSASNGRPGENALAALAHARLEAKQAIDRINAFFEKDWAAYQSRVDGIEKPMFPNITPVTIPE